MARDICRAWEIGYREAAAGKALIPYEELPANGVSPLRRDIFNRTYVAYKSGYRSGAQDLKEG